jgi:hypothetical protein
MAINIRYWRSCPFLLLIISAVSAFAQPFVVTGRIVDTRNEPVPFVSVQIEEEHKGTISNENGYFKITIKDRAGRTLLISSLGYKSQKQRVGINAKRLNIILESEAKQLESVFIYPDSSLKALIGKAYREIKNNYPQDALELTGFYRVSHKSASDGRYLYFTESSLRIQQGGYQHSDNDTQVEVIKVRNLRFPYRDSIDHIRYYAGAFMAGWNDPVRMKEPFLNPASFNKQFTYQLETVMRSNFDKDSVYVVAFKSMDKHETKQGKIWIDKKTVSYQKIEWTDTDPRNVNPFIPSKRINRSHLAIYQAQGNTNLLKYALLKSKTYNSKTSRESIAVLEFIPTSFNLTGNYQPIPLEKRLRYGTLFSELENSNNVDFSEEYTTIEMDSSLQEAVSGLVTREDVKSPKQNARPFGLGTSRRDKLYRFARHISTRYALTGVFYKPLDVKDIRIKYIDQVNGDSRTIHQPLFFPVLVAGIDYELSPYAQLRINYSCTSLKANLYKVTSLGYYRYFLIKKTGNPLFLTASLGFSMGKTGFSLGGLSPEKEIILKGEHLTKNTKMYLGDKRINSQIGAGLEYRKRKYSFFCEVQFIKKIKDEDILLFKTKRNFLFTKTIVTGYPLKEISLTPGHVYNGTSPVTVSLGLRMSVL